MTNATYVGQSGALSLDDMGHRFRSRLFDECSRIEHWAVAILAKAKPKASTYLFGRKLAAVRDLAEHVPAAGTKHPLKHPHRVLELLDRLQPYATLRSSIGHAVQTIALRADGLPLFIYDAAACKATFKATVLTADDQERILREVMRIAKELADQRLR